MKLESIALHHGYDPDTNDQKAATTPIYQTSGFTIDDTQHGADLFDLKVEGNIYSRIGNPTNTVLEKRVAEMEGGMAALSLASGMAAISVTLFGLLKSGDHIVCDWTTYSSTHEMLDHRLTDYGITTTFVDTADLDAVRNAIQENTKVLYFESIANPSMKVPDFDGLVAIAHEKSIVVVCDNTFASPYVVRPLEWGVDIVIESATKFIGGHNDALGGVIAMKSSILPADFMEQIRWNTMVKWGSPLSPFNAWVLLRGIQTLSVRLERQCQTAMKLAKYFSKHPKVKSVWYPGLENHPQHALAKKQMPKYGGMLTFEVSDGDKALTVLDSLELACFAASLGGVRTTTQIPATMAFLDIPEEERQEMGIYRGMIRVSTGLEDADDLIADFESALALV
jgi:methionine-gamma-lyase